MGIFSTANAFDQPIEKLTDEKNTTEDWGLIMGVCDRVGATTNGPKDCLKALVKRLNHQDPHVVMQALTLLDACVNNCGRNFLLEVASREFETEFTKLIKKSHPKIQEKMKKLLKTWAEGEFKTNPEYALIPSMYNSLKKEGLDFSSSSDQPKKKMQVSKDPNVVNSQQEEDDIAKAIQLSLQEEKQTGGATKKMTNTVASASSLYPTESLMGNGGGASAPSSSVPSSTQGKAEKKARALYDFEAAEDNELTFQTGEILIILDDSDPNWWKGSNHRGEGLFPSNFVTLDMNAETEAGVETKRKSVQFNEEVEVKPVEQVTFPAQTTVDPEKIDQLLSMLHDADPTNGDADPPSLPRMEDQVDAMGPLIDQELERVDRRHAQLTRLSHELVDALSLYHSLMREVPGMPPAGAVPGYAPMQYPMYAPPMGGPPPQYGYMEGAPGGGPPQQQIMSPPPQNSYAGNPHGYAVSAPPPMHLQDNAPQYQTNGLMNGPG